MIGQVIDTARNIDQWRDTRHVALKVAEETGELAQAVMKNQGYDEVVKEVADVIIAATDVGWLAFCEEWNENAPNIRDKYETDLMNAIRMKLDKWVQVYGK